MTRDEVLIEFHEPYDVEIVPGLRRRGMQLNTEAMADEIVRLRDALATVSGERDALVNLVEVLRQYYQMEATDDALYAAFCAWRDNPFTGKASA